MWARPPAVTSTSSSSRAFVVRHRAGWPTTSRQRTPIEWEVLEHWPDYRGELPGAMAGGRSLWPRPLRLRARYRGAASRPPSTSRLRRTTPANSGVAGARPTTGWSCGATSGDGPWSAGLLAGARRRRRGGPHRGPRHRPRRSRTAAVVGVVVDGRPRARAGWCWPSGGFQHDTALVERVPARTAHRPHGAGGVRRRRTAHGAWRSTPVLGEHDRGVVDAGHAGARARRSTASPTTAPCTASAPNPGRSWSTAPVGASSTRPRTTATWAGPCGRHRRDTRFPVRRAGWCSTPRYRRRYPVGPLEPGDARPATGSCAAGDLDELARLIGVAAGHAGGHGDAVQRRRRRSARTPTSAGARFPTTVGSETAAPLTRRWPRCARPPSTPSRSISAAWGPRVARAPTTAAGCCRRGGAPVPGLYAAGNAAASPFGTATAGGRRHARARPRVRLPGRRGRGG